VHRSKAKGHAEASALTVGGRADASCNRRRQDRQHRRRSRSPPTNEGTLLPQGAAIYQLTSTRNLRPQGPCTGGGRRNRLGGVGIATGANGTDRQGCVSRKTRDEQRSSSGQERQGGSTTATSRHLLARRRHPRITSGNPPSAGKAAPGPSGNRGHRASGRIDNSSSSSHGRGTH